MLAGAGLMIHSLWNLTHVDLGIRTDHVLGFYLDSPSIPQRREEINAYYRRILASIGAVPGVTHVSAMEDLPLDRLHFAVPFSISGSQRPVYAGPLLDLCHSCAFIDGSRYLRRDLLRGRPTFPGDRLEDGAGQHP